MPTETDIKTPSIRLSSKGDIVEVRLFGQLTREDYEAVVPVLEQLLDHHDKLRFLVFMEDFHGWKPSAFWEEMKFDFRHRDRIGSIAMIGDSTWQKLTANLSKIFLSAPVRFFGKDKLAEARSWLVSAKS